MPTSYVFDPVLNLDKCFQNTPPSILQSDDLHQLPHDWLIELEKQCRKIKPNLEKNIFLTHVGPHSSYILKTVLLEQLSFIFYHISDHLHSKSKHESIQLLLLVLTEDIKQCTTGFHIRVNKLVNSLQIPDTLEQLLYLVRKNIVQEIAYNLMDSVSERFQVHDIDRVYRIAKMQGLGIEPYIQKDHYKSLLSDKTIGESLQNEFSKHYTPLKIPFLLAEQLQVILHQSGYTGSEETGYAIGPIECMLKIIQNFITNPAKQNSNKLQPLFILDMFDEFGDPTRIYDLNLPLIRQLFFQKLIGESYFTDAPKPANLIEYAYFQSLETQNANQEQELKFLNYYVKEKNYAALIEDLILIQDKFPDYWQKIIKTPIIIKNIDNFLSFLENKSKNIVDDMEFLKKENQIYLLLFSQDKEFILGKIIVGITNCITDVNHNLLLKSIRYCPEITKDFFNLLFNTPSKHSQKLFLKLLFQKNCKGNDLLMFAARYHTKTIAFILHFLNKYIDQIEKEKISALFIQQNNDSWNLLSLAARHQSDAISCIFDFINRNLCYFDYEIFRTMVYQQNKSEWNFLQILIRYQSENQINNFLDFISEKFQFSNNKKWLEIILNNTHTRHLLYLAIRSNKSALNSILDFISKHIKQLDFQVLQKCFSDQNIKGWHCLHNVACSNSSNLELILEFIQKHIDQFNEDTLNDLFLAKNQAQENFLQLAVHYQSAETVDTLFKFLNQQSKFFHKANLQQLFLQHHLAGWNVLSMSYLKPANLKLILDFINEHPDSFDADTIKKIILQKNNLNYYTCLHFAARFEPDSLKIILEFIDKHFALFVNELKLLFENSSKFKVFTTLFRKPTSQTINLLEFSLKHQQESAAHFSKFLNTHADEFNLEKSYLKNFIKRATNKILLDGKDLKSVVPRIN